MDNYTDRFEEKTIIGYNTRVVIFELNSVLLRKITKLIV